jgi:hypothetical protein
MVSVATGVGLVFGYVKRVGLGLGGTSGESNGERGAWAVDHGLSNASGSASRATLIRIIDANPMILKISNVDFIILSPFW